MTLAIRQRGDGVTIECRVTPRAARSAIKGERDGVLQVALDAPPVEGRANDALVAFLAGLLGIPRSRITILRGDKGRTKLLLIQGIASSALLARLPLPPAGGGS